MVSRFDSTIQPRLFLSTALSLSLSLSVCVCVLCCVCCVKEGSMCAIINEREREILSILLTNSILNWCCVCV